MKHALDVGELPGDVQGVPVGVPVMDDGGQIQLFRQGQLAAVKLPAARALLLALDPVVVQTDLPHRHAFGVAAQLLYLTEGVEVHPFDVLGVDPGGEVEKGELLRQVPACSAALQGAAGADDLCHAVLGQGGDKGLPVGVKGVGVIVGVGVEELHGLHLRGMIETIILRKARRVKKGTVGVTDGKHPHEKTLYLRKEIVYNDGN